MGDGQLMGMPLQFWTASVALALALTGCVGADPSGSPIDAPGIETTVELTAPPTTGAGTIPTFEWSAVEGASVYRLAVKDPDDAAVWAWEGSATSIELGAVPDREEGDGGPILTSGSTWSVVALDAEGHVIAVSTLRPVSP